MTEVRSINWWGWDVASLDRHGAAESAVSLEIHRAVISFRTEIVAIEASSARFSLSVSS